MSWSGTSAEAPTRDRAATAAETVRTERDAGLPRNEPDFPTGPTTADELRQALDDLSREGYVLIHRDELATLRAAAVGQLASDADRPALRRALTFAMLRADVDLLAETLVDLHFRDRKAAA